MSQYNEAVITFVTQEPNPDFLGERITYTKVHRVEFEGTPTQFLQALNYYAENDNTWLRDAGPRFKVVSMETMISDAT